MKVYVVMQYWSEEYHLQGVYANKDQAIAKVNEDLNGFDKMIECELIGMP